MQTRGGRGFIHQFRSWNFGLIGVMLFAALFRISCPGLYQFKLDEASILQKALRLVRHGEWVWLSNHTSWGGLAGHSPLSVYIPASQYLFTTDPRVPRFVVGLMSVLAVGVITWTVQRYYGRAAAVITGLLLAASPMAVEWGTFVWNPNYGPLFIALWVCLGLLGYYEGKPWPQALHWLMLGLAIQAHPGNILIAPLSLGLLISNWFHKGTSRRILITYAIVGWGLALLTAIPWIIGLLDAGFESSSTAPQASFHYTLQDVWGVFSEIVSGTDFWTNFRTIYDVPDTWWPSLKLDKILAVKTGLTLAGIAWLLIEVYRKQWKAMPGGFLALLAIWPLIGFLVSPISLVDFYVMALMFGAFPVQGILFAHLLRIQKWAWVPITALIAVFLFIQTWLIVGAWRWLNIGGTQEAFRAPIWVHRDLLQDWAEKEPNLVLLTETVEAKYGPSIQGQMWDVLADGYSKQIVEMAQGIPIHPDGTVIVGTYRGTTIPTLFENASTAGELSNGDPIFRLADIAPGFTPTLDFIPESESRFGNGARILGVEQRSALQPGQPWQLILYWTPEQSRVKEQYQFSIRLVDEQNNTYGQFDLASLSGSLWRKGDTVINIIPLPIGQTIPENAILRLQLLMYSWPDMASVSVIDDAGNPISPWMFLPIGE